MPNLVTSSQCDNTQGLLKLESIALTLWRGVLKILSMYLISSVCSFTLTSLLASLNYWTNKNLDVWTYMTYVYLEIMIASALQSAQPQNADRNRSL